MIFGHELLNFFNGQALTMVEATIFSQKALTLSLKLFTLTFFVIGIPQFVVLSIVNLTFDSPTKKSEEERIEFFASLNIETKNVIGIANSVTPTRSNLIAKVKFDLLKNYFISKGKTGEVANSMSFFTK